DAVGTRIDRALVERQRGRGRLQLEMAQELRQQLAARAEGDARRALNRLVLAADMAVGRDAETATGTQTNLEDGLRGGLPRGGTGGDCCHDRWSALQTSVRGSDPAAALYWLARMLEAGCDPRYVARRATRMASEDIGNADPRALRLCLDAWETYERLGSPEGELTIAQAIVYMASTAKSNAMYSAYKAAMKDAREHGTLEVPMHIRNAPTKLMQELGYAKGYRYAHNETGGYAAGETYLPDAL